MIDPAAMAAALIHGVCGFAPRPRAPPASAFSLVIAKRSA